MLDYLIKDAFDYQTFKKLVLVLLQDAQAGSGIAQIYGAEGSERRLHTSRSHRSAVCDQ
jgi:hypothetical protein